MATETCPIRVDGTYCGEPAAFRVVAMCVHEHQLGAPACVTCVEDARRLFLSEPQACIYCRESAQPHTCVVDVKIEAI